MNTNQYLNSKVASTKPAVFSDEIEGEGMELCLRGLLVACLLAALAISNLSIGNGRRGQSAQADSQTVALVQPAAEVASAPAANL